jgi:hypothetical protein
MPMISPSMTGSSIIGLSVDAKEKNLTIWKLFNLVSSLVFKSCLTELVLTTYGMQNLHQAFNKNCGIFYVSCSHVTEGAPHINSVVFFFPIFIKKFDF